MTVDRQHLKKFYNIETLLLKVPNLGTYTNVYVVTNKNSIIMIDTGSRIEANIVKLSQYLEGNGKDVYLLLTHEHTDHMGLARTIQKLYKATVYIHNRAWKWTVDFESEWDRRSEEVRKMLCASGFPDSQVGYFNEFDRVRDYGEGFESDVYVDHNDILSLGGRKIKVIHTPGHSDGSVCYHDYEYDLLFCGDHIVGGFQVLPSSIDWAPDSGHRSPSINDSLKSFSELHRYYNGSLMLPGHGDVVTDLGNYRNTYVDYVRKFEQRVLNAIRSGTTLTPFELYKSIYGDSRLRSPTHFFGRIQLLFSVLDLLESERAVFRVNAIDDIRYSARGVE